MPYYKETSKAIPTLFSNGSSLYLSVNYFCSSIKDYAKSTSATWPI